MIYSLLLRHTAIFQPFPAIRRKCAFAGGIVKRQLFVREHFAPAAIGAFVQACLRAAFEESAAAGNVQFAALLLCFQIIQYPFHRNNPYIQPRQHHAAIAKAASNGESKIFQYYINKYIKFCIVDTDNLRRAENNNPKITRRISLNGIVARISHAKGGA